MKKNGEKAQKLGVMSFQKLKQNPEAAINEWRSNEVVFFDNSMFGLDRYLMDIGFSFLVNNMFFI